MPTRLVLILSAVIVAVPAAPATAATLTRDGQALQFTAAADIENDTSLAFPAGDVVEITTKDDAVFHFLPADCTDADGDPSEAKYVVKCTNTAAITLDLGDRADTATMAAAPMPVTWNGNAGADSLSGNAGPQRLDGGPGTDTLAGGEGDDLLDGGDDMDMLDGGPGVDGLAGGADLDGITGGAGADQVDGGDGDDYIDGGVGDDVVAGGAGADTLVDSDGAAGRDDFRGGPGRDSVARFITAAAGTGPGGEAYDGGEGIDQFVFHDLFTPAQAVDLTAGTVKGVAAPDAVTGMEDVQSATTAAAGVPDLSMVGTAGPNRIVAEAGNVTVDARAGNDQVDTGRGDDTIDVRDGYADRVVCRGGADAVQADALDVVADDCETVTVSSVTNANDTPEDAPPAVTFDAPAAAAALSTTAANVITATATDDRGVKHVAFSTGERTLCVDATAPYSCAYTPTSADVGRDTLVVTAVDTAGQTATAVRVVGVPRFRATALTAATSPKRDRRAPYTFTTRGKLALPAGVAAAAGCSGTVDISFKAGRKTVSSRRVALRPDCTYRSKLTFRLPRRLKPRRLNVVTVFSGNEVVEGIRAKRHTVRSR